MQIGDFIRIIEHSIEENKINSIVSLLRKKSIIFGIKNNFFVNI